MKRPRAKLIGGIILLILLSVFFYVFSIFGSISVFMFQKMDTGTSKIGTAADVISNLADQSASIYTSIRNSSMVGTELTATALRTISEKSWDGKVSMLDNGAMVKVLSDRVEAPDDFPKDIVLLPEMFEGNSGITATYKMIDSADLLSSETNIEEDTQNDLEMNVVADDTNGTVSISADPTEYAYVLYYSRINGPFYYIELVSLKEQNDALTKYMDVNDYMKWMEDVADTKILLIADNYEYVEDGTVLYCSEGLPTYEFAESYGISKEMLEGGGNTAFSVDSVVYSAATLTIEDETYQVMAQKIESMNVIFVLLSPMVEQATMLKEQIKIGTGAFLILAISFFVWMFSILMLVRKRLLNNDQRKLFSPKRIIWQGVLFAALLSVIVGICTVFSMCVFSLYRVANETEYNMQVLAGRINDNLAQKKIAENASQSLYEDYTLRVARILEQNPELCNSDIFASFSQIIGADYLMLFDSDGNESITDSRFSGISLGTNESSSTYDFRRLLNGVEVIAHGVETDPATGITSALIGASVKSGKEQNGYEALIMSIPEKLIKPYKEITDSDIMHSLTIGDRLSFEIDQETSVITASNDSNLVGNTVAYLGLPEKALTGNYKNFLRMMGKDYYIDSSGQDGKIIFCASEERAMYGGTGAYGIFSGVMSFIFMLLLLLYTFFGYKKNFEIYSNLGDVLEESEDKVQVPGSKKRKRSVDPSKRWRLSVSNHGSDTPIHNAFIVFEILLVIVIVITGFILYTRSTDSNNSIIAYVIRGDWVKGFNLFAYLRIAILFAFIAIFTIVSKGVLVALSRTLGTKGETICRLLLNFVNYAGVILFAYYSLSYLGFDTGTLLASLGLLSFAISLGAKDLVTDIVSGISIVFEGEYQVGDIIEIGGFRGTVLEIGVRSTKVEGRGGNIKIINNRDVKNVLNMTRKTSWYPLNISIPANQALENIEQLLRENLPAIGEQIPEVVSGPFYKGITEINKGSLVLSIITECNEADYHLVQREVNHAVQKILEENKVTLG